MAGIFTDVSSDIQKLQQLKNEIESVKKALKGINIKVDVDIAKGLESQLQSLMRQYDALVRKVSEAEGKIMISTQRINQASEKIIKAQEQLSKAAGVNPQPSGGNANTAANNAETASVQAQAKAYEDLKDSIEGYLGTIEGNARFLAETKVRIKAINTNISVLEKSIKSQGYATEKQTQQLAKYNQELAELKIQSQDARRELNTGIRINVAGEGSLKALQGQLLQMQRTWEGLKESVRNSQVGRELASSIELANKKVSELEQSMGRYQRNVGNYASGWNGLNMSVQQIVRELPAATMGLNMFFLAISNNLPILTDEIKRAVEANKMLKAQNQATVPVWQQLVSSIFSWQTAMMVAITVFSMYGKEIVSWIGNLFKAKEAINYTRIEQEKLSNAMNKARDSAAEETAELKTLYAMTQNTNASIKDRLAAVSKLQQQYPAYFGNLSKEAILAGEASNAYRQLTNDIMAAAYARAYQERIDKLASQNVKEKRGSLADYNYMNTNKGEYEAAWERRLEKRRLRQELESGSLDIVKVNDYKERIQELQKTRAADDELIAEYTARIQRWRKHNENYKRNEKEMKSYEKEVLSRQSALMKIEQGTSYIDDKPRKTTGKTREQQMAEYNALLDEQKQEIIRKQRENELEIRQNQIDTMDEGTEKGIKQIKLDYDRQKNAIREYEEDLKREKLKAAKSAFEKNPANKGKAFDPMSADVSMTDQELRLKRSMEEKADHERERSMENLYMSETQAMRDYLKEYGTYQEKRLAIAEEYADRIAKAQTAGERQSLQAAMDDALSKLDFEQIKDKMNWEDIFGSLSDLTVRQLEGIRGQLRDMLADGDMGLDEYKTAVEQINKVNTAIVEKNEQVKESLGLILPMAQRRKEIEMEVAEAERTVNSLMREMLDMQDTLSRQRQNVSTYLKTSGIDVGVEDVKTENFDGILSKVGGLFGEDSEAYKKVRDSFDNIAKSGRKLTSITEKLTIAQDKESGERTRLNEYLQDFGNKLKGVSEVMALVNSNMQSLPDLFSQLGIGMSGDFGKGINDLANASQSATNALQDAMSGNFVGALSNGIGAVKGVLSGFNNILGLGIGKGNTREVAEITERLTESNERLRDSIDRLKDRMDESAGGKAIEYYQQAVSAQEQVNRQTLEILKAQMAYTGSHHSNAYNWGNAVTGETAERIYGSINKTLADYARLNPRTNVNIVSSYEDMFRLTPEQMAFLRDQNREIWEEITDIGRYDKSQYWDDYADLADKLGELTEQLNESITQISFDSLRDGFMSTLMDMNADARDFADDFSEYMMKSLLNFQIGDMFDDELRQWYDDWAKAVGDSGGRLSDEQLDDFRRRWESMTDEALALRDSLADTVGYTGEGSSSSQKSTKGTYEGFSQDQGNEISGRLTAMYESDMRQEGLTITQTQSIMDLKGSLTELADRAQRMYNVADDTRNILAQSYLELRQISENTGEIVKPIKDMQKDISEVRRNTSRL